MTNMVSMKMPSDQMEGCGEELDTEDSVFEVTDLEASNCGVSGL